MSPEFDALNLRPGSPFRPVTWRWQVAQEIRSGPPNRRRAFPDAQTRTAAEVQDGLERYTAADKLRALERVPDLADAYAFWVSGTAASASGGPTVGPLNPIALAQAELEAMVLAGKKPEKIAAHTGMSVGAVGWYEALWFDARSRRKHAGWIAANVIGSLHQGTVTALIPALIRAMGYYTRSMRIVKAVTSSFDARAARASGSDPSRFFAADAIFSGRLKASLATRLYQFDPRTFARIIELHHEAVDLETKTRQVGGSENETKYLDAINNLKRNLQTAGAYGWGDSGTGKPAPKLMIGGAEDDG